MALFYQGNILYDSAMILTIALVVLWYAIYIYVDFRQGGKPEYPEKNPWSCMQERSTEATL